MCEAVGYAPDLEQRLALDLIFAMDDAGKSAAFEFGIVVPRQNMKTGLFKQAALGWLFITEQRLIVWSAHEFSTAKEALRDLAALIDGHPALRKRLKTVRFANDDPSIELTTGQRIKFKARTKSGGRGLTGDRVVLDEAFELTADHMGALLPTLSAVPDPQILYGSSAGLHHSDILRGIRDRGRAGSSGRLAYLEWTGETDQKCREPRCTHAVGVAGCVLDRADLWAKANPLLGRRRSNGTGLTVEYVKAERQAMPPAEFARERMGWWDDGGVSEPAFGPGAWEACVTGTPSDLQVGALAVAVAMDLTRASIVAAAADGDVVHVKPLQVEHGTGWTIDALLELQAAHNVPVTVDGRGPGAMLIPSLERAGVRLQILTTTDVLDACAGMFDAVREARVGHCAYSELDLAVGGAVKRTVGDRWAWGRKQSSTDISPLEAATLARWSALQGAPAEPFALFG